MVATLKQLNWERLPRPDLAYELQQILEQELLYPVFMPIYDIQAQKILGYESLIRGPVDSFMHLPDRLFNIASQSNLLTSLELACRKQAVTRFQELQLPGKLFINVSPQVLLEPDFKSGMTRSILHDSGLPESRVVIELTEHQKIQDYSLMKEAVKHYRSEGFTVALDDLGAGYSGLLSWAELAPEIVKLDRNLVLLAIADTKVRKFVASLASMAQDMDACVIAEGIETREQAEIVQSMNINVLQGYLFSLPSTCPPLEINLDSSAPLTQ